MTKSTGRSEVVVASVDRAIDLLDAFENDPRPLSLAELAERTGLYKSTILRLIDTLVKREYLTKLHDGTYQVGIKPFILGSRYQSAQLPGELILSILRRLVEETKESASFNIVNANYRVCLWRVDSPHSIRDHIQPGDIRPLGKGAAGRVLLAFTSDDSEHELARRQLLARSFGEVETDMAGVATPIFGPAGECRGSLSLSGPVSRFTDEAVKNIESALLRASIDLTRCFGGDTKRLSQRLADVQAEHV